MALHYTGTSDSSKFAIVVVETGYDVTGWKQQVDDPKHYKLNRLGTKIGFWSSFDESMSLTIDGEVNGDLDSIPPVMLAVSGPITTANIFDMDTITTGDVFHDNSEVTQSQGPSIATFSTSATRHPSITEV